MREFESNVDPVGQAAEHTNRAENEVLTYDFLGREPHEVQAFLARVYAENKFKSAGTKRRVRTRIRTAVSADMALCNVNHAAAFSFESIATRHSFLVVSCTGGSGTLQADQAKVSVFNGRSIPISATGLAGIAGEPALTHLSIHISAERIQSLCAHWIGSPLAQPLVFDLSPFAPELTIAWQRRH